jgi:hypothetical protein
MLLKNSNASLTVLALGSLVWAAGCAQDKAGTTDQTSQTPPPSATVAQPAAAVDPSARAIAEQMPTYPTEACVVCDSPLTVNETPVDVLHEGRLVRVCCTGCAQKFLADPEPPLAKVDAAIIAAQSPTYPLQTCPIEDAKLGSMGEPVKIVHETRLVQLCCADCEAGFRKDPAAAMAKVDAAYMDAQRAGYPAELCPLMDGMKIGAMGPPKDLLYGTQLVRLCCEDCVDKFWENPEAAMAQIAQAKGGTPPAGS